LALILDAQSAENIPVAPFHPLRNGARALLARAGVALAVFTALAVVVLAGGSGGPLANAKAHKGAPGGGSDVVGQPAVPETGPPPETEPPAQSEPPAEAAPPAEVEKPAEPVVPEEPTKEEPADDGSVDEPATGPADEDWGHGEADEDRSEGAEGEDRGDGPPDQDRGYGEADEDWGSREADDDGGGREADQDWGGREAEEDRGDDPAAREEFAATEWQEDFDAEGSDPGRSGARAWGTPTGGSKVSEPPSGDSGDEAAEPAPVSRPQIVQPEEGAGTSPGDPGGSTPDSSEPVGDGKGNVFDSSDLGGNGGGLDNNDLTAFASQASGSGGGSDGTADGDTAGAGAATDTAAGSGADSGDAAGGDASGGGAGSGTGDEAGKEDGPVRTVTKTVTREVERLVNYVPDGVKAALAALAALSILLGLGYLLAAVRARRLSKQRRELLQEVGLLQSALLPPVPDKVGSLRTSVAYRPADGPGAGGDFYDVLALAGGRVGFILGDVSGHGRGALARTAFMRYTLRAYLEAGLEPRVALQVAGRVIDDNLGGDFATVLLAVHDPETGSLTYATAGHPAPIVVGPQPHDPVTAGSSPPIGVGVRTGVRQTTVPLVPGAVAALFTDGLMEARTADGILGRERLTELLEELGDDANARRLIESVAAQSNKLSDDMAAVIVSPTSGVTAGLFRTEQLELSARELEGPIARRFLEACGLPAYEVEDAEHDARLLAERFGGVILHVVFGNRLRVEVLPRNVESIEAASRRVSAGTAP
jgi:serine phosphatase RsbU (regulator of sigma subunit)